MKSKLVYKYDQKMITGNTDIEILTLNCCISILLLCIVLAV